MASTSNRRRPGRIAGSRSLSRPKDRSATARFKRAFSTSTGKVLTGVTILLTTALTAIGTQIGTALFHGSTQVVANTHSPGGLPTNNLGSHGGLGVDTAVAYGNTPGVGLPTALTSGSDYLALLGGQIGDSSAAGFAGRDDWESFLDRNRGAPVTEMHVDLVVTGEDSSPIRITNVRIVFTAAPLPNLTGTYIPLVHGGGQNSYNFIADLDSASPTIVGTAGQESFPDFNIELAAGEQSTLAIDFTANKHYYAWVLYVDYLKGTEKRSYKVTAPSGRPFTITGSATTYHATYTSDYPTDTGYHL